MRKIFTVTGSEEHELDYGLVYEHQVHPTWQRIVTSDSTIDHRVLKELLRALGEKVILLYILHTPRGEQDPGRYESEVISQAEAQSFIDRFAAYLHGDARFDIWFHGQETNATIVLDRHDLIYCYGLMAIFTSVLVSRGYSSGKPLVPFPHSHHYRPEFDRDGRDVLSAMRWKRSNLRPEDEQ